jgi:DNA polymerase I
MNSKPKLFLIDAYALIFRAYYAFINRPMVNSKGFNTSAILGFFNSLAEVIRKEKPDYIAVAFDPPDPTFRNEIFTGYKAKRMATPEEINLAVPYIKEMLTALNIKIIETDGFEADDVIGTLAKAAEKKGWITYMMTMDKDFLQLVSENIFMYRPPAKSDSEAEIIGVNEIREKFGISDPCGIIDILALWGDTSDNIPGVPGIGEKISKELISRYHDVHNLLEHLDEIKGSIREKLETNRDQIYISRKLAQIITDAPVNISLDDLKMGTINEGELRRLCNELEFKSLLMRLLELNRGYIKPEQGSLFGDIPGFNNEIPAYEGSTIDTVDHSYTFINGPDEAEQLVRSLAAESNICLQVTGGLVLHDYAMTGIALTAKKNEAVYISIDELTENGERLLQILKPLLENPETEKTGHNLKTGLQILRKHGITVAGPIFDTMVAHYLIQPEYNHGLDYLSETYLNYKPLRARSEKANPLVEPVETIRRSGKGNEIAECACESADISYQLYGLFKDKISSLGLTGLSEKVEMPLVSVLADMELAGFSISRENLYNYSAILRKDIITVKNEIYGMAGQEFNISSPKQLGEILFDKLKISDSIKRTKTNQFPTGEEVLSKLTDKHPIINKILDFRAQVKLLNTYVDTLPLLIDKKSGKVHTSFDQASVATGRLSSRNPNLQNIPIREERGREIRKAFIPGNGNILVSADYSQIELRLMAHLSSDEDMIDAFVNNEDIHTATAAKIFKVPPELVSREMRSRAKTANFGIIYGISAFGLSRRLNISKKEASEFIEGYFNTYRKVKDYMNRSINNAKEKGYVETIMGRRRYLKDINSANAVVRGFAERNAINAPLQGSAADIIKYAMVRIHRHLNDRFKTKMILQVHDELVFDVYKPEKEEVIAIVKYEMEHAADLKVPIVVEIGYGNNWLEAH